MRAVGQAWADVTDEDMLSAPLPLGWPLLDLLLEAAPAQLTNPDVFDLLLEVLRHADAECKLPAISLLLKLLQLPPQQDDGREAWKLGALLPLHQAVSYHRSRLDTSRLLPRHSQLYAEVIAAIPGCGYCTEACLPRITVEEARLRVLGGTALPPECAALYKQIAAFGNVLVAVLADYRIALGEVAPTPLAAAFAALPSDGACEYARAALKKWMAAAGEGEGEVASASSDPADAERPETMWTPDLDGELLRFVRACVVKLKTRNFLLIDRETIVAQIASLRAGSFGGDGSLAVLCHTLLGAPVSAVAQRWQLLRRINQEIEGLLPFVHTGWTSQPHTIGARLCALRALLLPELKYRWWDSSLPSSPQDEGVVKAGQIVSLNRWEAEAVRAGTASGPSGGASCCSLFDQMFNQLHKLDPKVLRRRDRAFKVKFVGEASDDYGGPYREAITNVCAELQSAASPLFVLCPNGQHGIGNNRSSFTVRPAAAGQEELQRFFFLGKLMGCALLQHELVLDLQLCPHVWKRLAAIDLSPPDLAEFDFAEFSSLRKLLHIEDEGVDQTSFADLIFNSFDIALSDGTRAELFEGGTSTPVTFTSRGRYCSMALDARLAEGAAQCSEMLAGLSTIVPNARLLSLMTEQELELLMCGEARVDVEALRSHVRYGAGVTPKQRHVRFLWQVLEGFDTEQRRVFLKFIWGRTRLPLAEEDWGEQRMRVHTLDTRSPDTHFPVAHTCFFSIEWPQYSTLKVAREKLLYAINNCNQIDADNTREGRANASANAFF